LQSLIDTHCHLYLKEFENDVEEVILRALQNGVGKLIVPGIDIDTSRMAIHLSTVHDAVYAAVGIHPNTPGGLSNSNMQLLQDLAQSPKVVAIGEIGLDYHRQVNTKQEQIALLQAQISLAMELDLPILLHNRDSSEDLISILEESINKKSELTGCFHAFTGDEAIALFALKNDFFLGIGGAITYDKYLKAFMNKVDLCNHLLLETDAPFMSPASFRGKRNEPANLSIICESLANLLIVKPQELGENTTRNAMNLFWKHENETNTQSG
jgi:TatD DNase family protein